MFSNNKLPQKKITRWVGGGHGIGGYQEDFFIHAGLGQLSEIDVEIFWPHRLSKSQKLRLKANQHYLIKEGQEARVLFR